MNPKRLFILCILCTSIFLTACSSQKTDTVKIRDLEFTVLEEQQIPEEFLAVIEEQKESEFKITYEDSAYQYIARGYGEQSTGGYSISINECYLTSNAIYFKTNLIGPDKTKEIPKASSYPYVVIKLERMDITTVVFQ